MNYQKRFNKIAETIGEREEIEGIDRIYRSSADSTYIAIDANEIEITRGVAGGIKSIGFSREVDWEILEILPERLEEWFEYVEEKVSTTPDEVTINGKRYRKVEE